MASTGKPVLVKAHDSPDLKKGKSIPYGVQDLDSTEEWGTVGIHHDMAQFATSNVVLRLQEIGSPRFPRSGNLLMTTYGRQPSKPWLTSWVCGWRCATSHRGRASGARKSRGSLASSPGIGADAL